MKIEIPHPSVIASALTFPHITFQAIKKKVYLTLGSYPQHTSLFQEVLIEAKHLLRYDVLSLI